MLNDITAGIRSELSEVKEYIREALKDQAQNEKLARLLSETMENPGKMIRPVVLLLAAGEYEKEQRDELIAAAAASEILHTSTLVLDDMLDSSPLRRGKKTIYAEYGSNVALYVGDYLLVRAYSYLLDKGYGYEASILMSVGQTACDGEMIQHENLHNASVRMEDYLAAISGKTACFFKGICTMASYITKKDEKTKAVLEEFGETLGMMFQIRDDLLDWQGRTEMTGKPANEDFLEGIYTMPAIYTFAAREYGVRLKAIAEKGDKTDEDVREAVKLVKESGGIAYTEDHLAGLRKKADVIISSLPSDSYTEALKKLAEYCAGKDTV